MPPLDADTSNTDSVRTRVVVCTDISSLLGGLREPDDTQSLVRLLLYANEFEIEGLIATDTRGEVHPEYIEAIVKLYGHCVANLKGHDPRYPEAQELLKCIKTGSPNAGVEHLGAEGNTEGSDWIISVADKPDPRPVWILFWGGPNELAQALWRVESERGKEGLDAFIAKLRIHAISDQDSTAQWIKERYPQLFYITNKLAFRGIYLGGDTTLVGWDWVHQNVRGKGPLGAAYPNYYGGDCFPGPPLRVQGVKEGDTPSFLYLVQNGLNEPMEPTWGSWGGRFQSTGHGSQFEDAADIEAGDRSIKATVYRWRAAFQNDFAACLNWTILPYASANHPPKVVLKDDFPETVISGESLTLDASDSSDPDGDALSFVWGHYPDAGTYSGRITFVGARENVCRFIAPEVTREEMVHLILTVTDNGTPPLSRYRRIILTILPRKLQ